MEIKIKYGTLLLIISVLIRQSHTWNKFCSVFCDDQKCNTQNSNDCYADSCASGFAWNTTLNKCEASTGEGWVLVDSSADIGGNMTSSYVSTQTCGPGLAGQGQWVYSYYDMKGKNYL